MIMIIRCLLVFSLWISIVDAALPPKYQNINDLRDIVEFIESSSRVSSTLTSIDFSTYTIYYGQGCQAVLGRVSSRFLTRSIGPSSNLVLKHSNCNLR
jgi:hypothetical protein